MIAAAARWQPSRAARAAVILLACVPFVLLAFDATNDSLGANPVEAVLHRTGDWALRLLLATLAVSPLRRWTGWPWLLPFRRLLGLAAFAYALLHGLIYVVLDRGLLWDDVVADGLEPAGDVHAHLSPAPQDFPDDDLRDRHASRLIAAAARFVPMLGGARTERLLLGWRPLPRDGNPVVGSSPRCPDVHVAVTHSGVTLGPLLGRLASIEILDGVRTDLLQPFRPDRF